MSPETPAPPSDPGRSSSPNDRHVRAAGSSNVSPCGFGPILQQEYALQAALEAHRSEASGPRARDLVRILDRQQAQLSTGIAALDRRCEDLPHAERFQRLGWREPPPDQPGTASASRPRGSQGLEQLAAMHLELAANIRDVMEHHLKEQAEPALEAVARDHEEMAWVLSALSHEGEFSEGDYAQKPDRPPNQTTGESRWENEGGSVEDQPNEVRRDDPRNV